MIIVYLKGYIDIVSRANVFGTGCIPPMNWRGLALLLS